MLEMKQSDDRIADDLLRGAGPVSQFLGMTPRQVYNLHARGDLPTFRLAGALCAKKSSLREHLARLESGSLKQAS